MIKTINLSILVKSEDLFSSLSNESEQPKNRKIKIKNKLNKIIKSFDKCIKNFKPKTLDKMMFQNYQSSDISGENIFYDFCKDYIIDNYSQNDVNDFINTYMINQIDSNRTYDEDVKKMIESKLGLFSSCMINNLNDYEIILNGKFYPILQNLRKKNDKFYYTWISFLGYKNTDKKIIIEFPTGTHLGMNMQSGVIQALKGTYDYVGKNMSGGIINVKFPDKQTLGFIGSGMINGEINLSGTNLHVYEAGDSMENGKITIHGDVKNELRCYPSEDVTYLGISNYIKGGEIHIYGELGNGAIGKYHNFRKGGDLYLNEKQLIRNGQLIKRSEK